MNAKDFEILASSLRPGLIRVAQRIVESRDEAEDVAQDVMLKLWSMRKNSTAITPWNRLRLSWPGGWR